LKNQLAKRALFHGQDMEDVIQLVTKWNAQKTEGEVRTMSEASDTDGGVFNALARDAIQKDNDVLTAALATQKAQAEAARKERLEAAQKDTSS
jgi:predicted lipoprotein